jgi:predicted PurR-regulated permease PerM
MIIMNGNTTNTEHTVTEQALSLLIIAILLLTCLKIAQPFIAAIFGGVVLCVSLWPVYLHLSKLLGNRRKLAAVIMTIITLMIFVIPLSLGADRLLDSIPVLESLADDPTWLSWLNPNNPPAWIAKIPMVGENLTHFWHQGLENLRVDTDKIKPLILQVAKWLLSQGAGFAMTMFEIILATVLAGLMYVNAEDGAHLFRKFARRISNAKSAAVIDVAGHTIRGVSLGVIGTAALQAALSSFGFAIAGIPIYMLLGAVCFITALLQIGTGLVWIPTAIWLGYNDHQAWAIFTVVWGIFINLIDNFIKPYVISKGSNLPLLVIFAGVIGGLLAWGFMGMFIGATLLAVAYTLFMEWLNQDRVG